MSDPSDTTTGKLRSLRETIREVRTAEAERSDVVVELRDAERARLELLAEELRSVFDEVPADDEQFIFTVAPGTPPRLWIDMTSFVMMGRDRRTYRFLKDTRLGRTVIRENADLSDVADTITQYVAERIIERDRALEGDWVIKRALREDTPPPPRGEARLQAAKPVEAVSQVRPRMDGRLAGWVVAAFLAGVLIGAAVLLGTAWLKV